MVDFEPKVSIVIPVYNGQNYLSQAIDSALMQTYNKLEIIIVNDGSTDETEMIAKSYGNKIIYFRKENGGQASALNYGIERMTGDFFSWLSHDDIYLPRKIEAQISALNTLKNKDEVILFSDYEVIDYKAKKVCDIKASDFNTSQFRYMLLTSSPINGCTALIPKKAFSEIGLFNIKRPHTSDYELFFKMAEKYDFVHMPEILVQSRIHTDQMTIKKASYHLYESNLFLVYGLNNISKEELIKTEGSINIAYAKLAKNWAKRGYKIAYQSAIKAYSSKESGLIFLIKLLFSCKIMYLIKVASRKWRYILVK